MYQAHTGVMLGSAAAIWSLADIAYIAIYRDMSKISRYCIAIFLSIFIEQLFIYNHTIFMQVEAALLCMVVTQEQMHKMLYGAEGERPARGVVVGGGGGGGGGGSDTVHWYAYTGITYLSSRSVE